MDISYYIVRFIRRDNRSDEEFNFVDTKEAEDFFNHYKNWHSKLYAKAQLFLCVGGGEVLIREFEFLE